MKAFLFFILLTVIGGCVFFVNYARKPQVVVRIEFNRGSLFVTNGNDQAWPRATVILNDAFDGPRLEIKTVAPGERREMELRLFYAPIKKQYFQPDFERVHEVIINVPGMQLGDYTR